jgi:hypothetical protein
LHPDERVDDLTMAPRGGSSSNADMKALVTKLAAAQEKQAQALEALAGEVKEGNKFWRIASQGRPSIAVHSLDTSPLKTEAVV